MFNRILVATIKGSQNESINLFVQKYFCTNENCMCFEVTTDNGDDLNLSGFETFEAAIVAIYQTWRYAGFELFSFLEDYKPMKRIVTASSALEAMEIVYNSCSDVLSCDQLGNWSRFDNVTNWVVTFI
jgi:hypothetical protein